MKINLFPFILFTIIAPIAAQPGKKNIAMPEDTYEFDSIAAEINGVGKPLIKENHVIFTAEQHKRRFVGIAFDFENFRTIHPFQIRKITDVDGKVTDSWFFYILDIPKNITSISYRLIIDGLWTTDPVNDLTEYNTAMGIRLSKIMIDTKEPPATCLPDNGMVRFIYQGESGQNIRLGGSFTNWDSWIYYMTETEPGLYEIDLPLPGGTYYYTFYHGISSFIDKTNPHRAYTPDGRIASVITIK
jgi:hypothetical protein